MCINVQAGCPAPTGVTAMKYQLQHVATCLSDYWGGHHLPHVSIPVDGTTTVKKVLESVRSELSQGAIAGSLDRKVIESEEFHTACMQAVQELSELNVDILNKIAFPNLDALEGDDDCSESVMAFFVFVPEEE